MRIIAGRWRGHTIAAPPGTKTRPTTDRVREAWMSAVQLDLPDARVLDLFAGSGALGLEALSRGARHATFVEKASGPLRALQANVHKLRADDDVEVVRGDALKFVAALEPHSYDAELFRERLFAQQLWIEHRAGEPMPQLPGAHTRRYGDTALTFIPAPESA
jgi:16S rRNA (guanine966-N2)-methyltransferase